MTKDVEEFKDVDYSSEEAFIPYSAMSQTQDPEDYLGRLAYAQELMAEGKSHKHAWFLAFQRFPKVPTE